MLVQYLLTCLKSQQNLANRQLLYMLSSSKDRFQGVVVNFVKNYGEIVAGPPDFFFFLGSMFSNIF